MPKKSGMAVHFCPLYGQQGVDEQTALSKGMEQKTVEFVKQGSQLYSKA